MAEERCKMTIETEEATHVCDLEVSHLDDPTSFVHESAQGAQWAVY